jgi:hypothetical protein
MAQTGERVIKPLRPYQERGVADIRGCFGPPADLLSQALQLVRPQLDGSTPLKQRIEIYWSAVAAATDLATVDIVQDEFLHLATETGLADDLREHADFYNSNKTLEHVLRWGLLRRNPFR